jgi:hypothetical protein
MCLIETVKIKKTFNVSFFFIFINIKVCLKKLTWSMSPAVLSDAKFRLANLYSFAFDFESFL